MRKFWKNTDVINLLGTYIPILFIFTMGAYHSGIYGDRYEFVWLIATNALFISFSLAIIFLSYSNEMRSIHIWLILPYFLFKIFYHVICYFKIYIVSPEDWQHLWNIVLILLFITGAFILCFKKLIKKFNVLSFVVQLFSKVKIILIRLYNYIKNQLYNLFKIIKKYYLWVNFLKKSGWIG